MKRKYYKKYELPETADTAASVPVAIPVNPILKKFGDLKFDDIIIPILIFLMLTEENPDYITIAALAFIYFA